MSRRRIVKEPSLAALAVMLMLMVTSAVAQASRPLGDGPATQGSANSSEGWTGDTRPADILFNSKLQLGVVIEDYEPRAPEFLYWSPHPSSFDITPCFFPIRISAGASWHVRPCAVPIWRSGGEPFTCPDYSDKDLSLLVDEVIAKKIPGISLVGCSGVTDHGIADLSRAKHLVYLDLGGFPKEQGPDLTDAGLRSIEGLSELTTLRLAGHWRDRSFGRVGGRVTGTTGITDEGLRSIGRFCHLRRLDLSGSYRITGAGVGYLAPLDALEWLGLTDSARSDPKPGLLESMPPFPRLTYLDVSRTEIDESDFAKILSLPALEVLRMEFCWRIRNEDLLKLAAMPRLTRVSIGCLDLYSCKMRITPEGIAALEKSMPRCRIEWLAMRPKAAETRGDETRPSPR